MEKITSKEKKTEYNINLLKEYLNHLKERYTQLEKEPFSTKARIKLNQEIENITSLVEEENMVKAWDNLNTLFSTSEHKPSFREAPSSFRESMSSTMNIEEWTEE